MARIAGIDLPKNKRGEIGLTYVYGIGRSRAQQILTECGIDWNKKVSEWTDAEQTVLGLQRHIHAFRDVIRHQSWNSDTEINVITVTQFLSGALRHQIASWR